MRCLYFEKMYHQPVSEVQGEVSLSLLSVDELSLLLIHRLRSLANWNSSSGTVYNKTD